MGTVVCIPGGLGSCWRSAKGQLRLESTPSQAHTGTHWQAPAGPPSVTVNGHHDWHDHHGHGHGHGGQARRSHGHCTGITESRVIHDNGYLAGAQLGGQQPTSSQAAPREMSTMQRFIALMRDLNNSETHSVDYFEKLRNALLEGACSNNCF